MANEPDLPNINELRCVRDNLGQGILALGQRCERRSTR